MKMLLVTVGALALSGCGSYAERYTSVCTYLPHNDQFPKNAVQRFCSCAAETYPGASECASVLSGPSADEFVKRAIALKSYSDPDNCGIKFLFEFGNVAASDDHVTTADVDFVLGRYGDTHGCKGFVDIAVESYDFPDLARLA